MKRLVFLFTILFLFSCGKSKKPSNQTIEEIYNWYYSTGCINNTIDSTGNVVQRNSKDRDFMISLVKINLQLDDNWKFVHQELSLIKISEIEYIFTIGTMFQNVKEDKNQTLHKEMYYFDLESVIPIPIKEHTYQTIGGKSMFKNERFLWMGDYNEYMKHYFSLEMKNMDTVH